MADLSSDLNLALRIRALVEGQDAVVGLGTSFIDLNQRIENLIRGLTAISGSTEGAQREFEYLADVAQKYGLKILDLSDNYVKLIASSKGTALEGEAVKKVFESVSGAMSVLGGDTITTHRAFTALAQMMSKGQIYSEELKGQLAEAIPGALGIMSRALGITTDDLRNLMEAGSLSAEVLLPFATQLSKEYGNLATSGRTFTQSVNDLKNTWTLLMERLSSGSGAFGAISASIEYLSKSSGVLAGIIGIGMASAFVKLTASISSTVSSVKNFIPLIGVQATATQRVAAANLEAAIATEATAAANARSALSSERLLKAQLAIATNAQVRQRIEAALQVAVAQRIISDKQAAAAALQLASAQGAVVSSVGFLSRALNFLAGPGGLILTSIAAFGAMAFAFREQDTATKNLSKSTEEYARSLETMTTEETAAAIKKAEIDRKTSSDRIAQLKSLIEYQQRQIDSSTAGSEQYNSYVSGQIKLVSELEKEESKLVDTDIKLGDSRSSLAGKSAKLILDQQKLSLSSDELNLSMKAQRAEIAALQKQKQDGESVDRALQDAQTKLAKTGTELVAVTAKLKENQKQQTIAMSDYVKSQQALAPAISGTSATLKDQGLTTEQLEAKFRALVQAQVLSVDRQNILKRSIIELNGEQEALGISLKSQVDLLTRQAAALGDVTAARAANIAKAEAERQSAQQSLIIARLELQAMEEERREKAIQLETNPKLAKQTGEQIAKLDALIAKQRAEVQARKDNVVATREEVEAAKVAGETISASQKRQASEASALQEQLGRLREQYADMVASGEQMRVIETVMEAIRLKEKEIADQAADTAIATSAAFKSLGLNAEEVLTGMDFETRKAIDALASLSIRGQLTGDELRKAMDKAISLADSEAEIKALIDALYAMQSAGVITSADLGVSMAALKQKLSDLQTGVDPVARALEKLGVGVPEKLAAVAEAAKLNFLVIQQSKQPIENVRDAFLKYADAAVASANASGSVIDPMLRQRAISLGLLTAYENLVAGMRRVSPELKNMKDRFGELSQIESERVSAIESIASSQETAMRAEIDYYKAIGATSVARQKEQELAAKQIEFSRSLIAAKYSELKVQLAEQGLKAALLEQEKASHPLYEQERQLIELTVEAINKKIDALREELKLTDQSGKNLAANSSITEKATRVTEQHTDAAQKDAESTKEQAKSYTLMEDSATGAVRSLSQMSAGMNELLSSMLHVRDVGKLFGSNWSGELGKLRLELQQTDDAIRHNLQIIGPYAGQFEKNANAANAARRSFLEQAIAAVGLTEDLTKLSGSVSSNTSELESLVLQAETAKSGMNLLDAARLDNLQKSIDAAKKKLTELQDETKSATDRITELNAEIAAAKGDTATSDKLKLQLDQQKEIATVEKNLAAARDAQNADLVRLYEDQLTKLNELYQIKEKNLEADIKAQKLAEQQKNAKDTTRDDKPTSQTVTSGTAPAGGATTINNTFLIDPTKLANEEWVKKNVMPTIEKVGRLRA